MCWPIGFSFGQYVCAIRSLTTTTGGALEPVGYNIAPAIDMAYAVLLAARQRYAGNSGRKAHRLEQLRRDDAIDGVWHLIRTRDGTAFNDESPVPKIAGDWDVIDPRRRFDAGKLADPVEHLLIENCAAGGTGFLRSGDGNDHAEHAVRIEAGLTDSSAVEAPDHESGGDEQRQRERKFRRDENAAQAIAADAITRAATAFGGVQDGCRRTAVQAQCQRRCW